MASVLVAKTDSEVTVVESETDAVDAKADNAMLDIVEDDFFTP